MIKSLSIFEKKIYPILKDYLNGIYINEFPKNKYIVLIDNFHCIPKVKIVHNIIFEGYFHYCILIHKNPIRRYVYIKENICRKEVNALIITDKEKKSLLNRSFFINQIRITPQILLDSYFKKLNFTEINFSEEINIIGIYIWNSIDFIEKNIERYSKKLKNSYFLEIIFQKIIVTRQEIKFFLKQLIYNPKLIISLYKNEGLREKLDKFISTFFPPKTTDVILNCIINENLHELFDLFTIISYIRQFNPNISNFKEAFEYINSRVRIIQNLDATHLVMPLNTEIIECGEISDNFLKLNQKIFLKNLKKELNLIKVYNFPNIIKLIEKKINIFQKNTTSLVLFPNFNNKDSFFKENFYDIPNFWLSSNFLEIYISHALDLFVNNDDYNRFRDKINLFICQNNKSIEKFKENLFFRIENSSSEYGIKLKYLQNFFEILLNFYYLSKDVIPNLDSIKDDSENWKKLFEKYIIPLNNSIEAIFENTLQFIPSSSSNIETLTLNILRIAFNNLKVINSAFQTFIKKNYADWVKNYKIKSTPLNTVNAISRKFLPNYLRGRKEYNLFLFIDACHLGIWNILKQKILNDFPTLFIKTEIGYSILPTLTKYARASLFSGVYPKDFSKVYPTEFEINVQNFNEFKGFLTQINKKNVKNEHFVTNCENIFDFETNIKSIKHNRDENFQISIFNFSDKSSHTFSQSFVKTLIDSIYHSKIRPLIDLVLNSFQEVFIFFATDHGSSRCTQEFNWKNVEFNLFWNNSNLFVKRSSRTFISTFLPSNYEDIKQELICLNRDSSRKWGLPNHNNNSQHIDLIYFFANSYYNLKKTPQNRRTLEHFGHGGSSMDEFIIPFATIKKKKANFKEFDGNIKIDLEIKENISNIKENLFNILITNNSNKEIVFNRGHLETEKLYYKIITFSDNLITHTKDNFKKIKLKIPKKYGKEASFYFIFFCDEKFEISNTINY